MLNAKGQFQIHEKLHQRQKLKIAIRQEIAWISQEMIWRVLHNFDWHYLPPFI